METAKTKFYVASWEGGCDAPILIASNCGVLNSLLHITVAHFQHHVLLQIQQQRLPTFPIRSIRMTIARRQWKPIAMLRGCSLN